MTTNTGVSRIDPQDVVILFADLQAGIVELAQTNPLPRLKTAVLALAKLAKLFNMPAIVSGIQGEDGGPAKVLPEIAQALGELPTHHRTTCDSFLNPDIVAAINGTGRKTLLISGVATELAVQLPALTASDRGYRVYVVLDACGGIERAHRTSRPAPLDSSRRHHGLRHGVGRRDCRGLPRPGSAAGDRNFVRDGKGLNPFRVLNSNSSFPSCSPV